MGSPTFWWRARLVVGGPDVGVKTFFAGPLVDGEILDRSPRWQCLIRSETTARLVLQGDECPIEVEALETDRHPPMLRNLRRTTEADWNYLVKHAAWATSHAPDSPDAAPRTAIDWNKVKPVF